MDFEGLARGALTGTLFWALLWALVSIHRLRRHVAYLRPLTDGRDYWDVPCSHCRRLMRDANSIADTHPGATPGSVVRSVYHMDREPCADAAREHARGNA
jgi:hypothetical protein